MHSSAGPFLFDVGIIALAHTDAPVRDAALDWLKAGIAGEIDAVVPYPAVIGAHHVLTAYYGRTNEAASRLLQNLQDATRIRWYDGTPRDVVRDGLSLAGDVDVGGWDGYYAAVAAAEGVNTGNHRRRLRTVRRVRGRGHPLSRAVSRTGRVPAKLTTGRVSTFFTARTDPHVWSPTATARTTTPPAPP